MTISSSSPDPDLPAALTSPPPPVQHTLVAFPTPQVLLVTLDRPAQLNAIARPQHFALARLWDWYDAEPSLRCAVITGSGRRAFCAGADLKEWDGLNRSGRDVVVHSSPPPPPSSSSSSPDYDSSSSTNSRFPPSGFGGLSNRGGAKPVIAAVDGLCLGGGMEMAINCDLVVASAAPRCAFALPEVGIGVVALAGALPRLVKSVGRQRAAEMALTGKRYSAEEMKGWGLVNEVVPDDHGDGNEGKGKVKEGQGYSKVVQAALRWAEMIVANSPDSVRVSREGLKLGWEGVGPEMGTDILINGWYGRMDKGENMVEGVKSFVERRKPVWKDSKL
ncbi:ClpP/crotonase-like domain-containing protein [Xylariomycetidae sp. FL2044]|nr:ClpP/crotonase-like domain-containing protein [Xylariomycetidae sp. FL2044]